MSKNFDEHAYLAKWDGKVAMGMLVFIVVSLVAVIFLNVATRPDCLRHEYIFCGTTDHLETGHHGTGHAPASEEAPGTQSPH